LRNMLESLGRAGRKRAALRVEMIPSATLEVKARKCLAAKASFVA